MLRKIVGIVVCMSMITLVYSETAVATPEPFLELRIGVKMGVRCIIVRNIGDSMAYDVEWNCNITGGMYGRIHKHIEGNISSLPPETYNETSQPLPRFFGFGIVRLTASASASNTNAIALNKFGLVFGFRCIYFP
jgi:hypothetical protein